MNKYVVANLFLLLTLKTLSQSPIRSATVDAVSEYYSNVVEKIIPHEVPFANSYTRSIILNEKPEVFKRGYHSSCLSINGQFYFIINKQNNDLLMLWNHRLDKYIRTNAVQYIPKLSIAQAIIQARQYLSDLKVSQPTNMILKNIGYCRPSMWEVRWEPVVQETRYDNFDIQYEQSVVVVFHERFGFVGYGWMNDYPKPKCMDVLVSQDDAVLKASKAIPLIQKSPYYLQCRMPGFVASGLHKAELLIAAPNWLLDPKRAIWLRDKPPEETRLCWVVTFTSVYTGKEDPGTMAVPPMFIVYIDAATGEIVGANFT